MLIWAVQNYWQNFKIDLHVVQRSVLTSDTFHNWMKQCNCVTPLQEQNPYLNKIVAEWAALESQGMGAKIPTFVTNTACDFKLLKIIYHNCMSDELWDLWVKDALKVQLLEPIYKKAVAINILQDITKYLQLMVMYW